MTPSAPRPDATSPAFEATLGESIRTARQRVGMSLRELARRVGITPGFLSQLENGGTGPSVATLYYIARELGVGVDGLLAPPRQAPDEPIQVVRDGGGLATLGAGVQWRLLAAGGVPGVEFREIIYEPGAQSSPAGEPGSHPGTAFGLVLEGRLGLEVTDASVLLDVGDSAAFEPSRPHRFWNAGPGRMRSVWLIVGATGAGLQVPPVMTPSG